MDYPDYIIEYYEQKGRPIPSGPPDPVSNLLRDLDTAVALMLNCGGTEEAVEKARRAVLDHPDSTWKESVLDYRTRQLHYK